jgi:hypothetical protein
MEEDITQEPPKLNTEQKTEDEEVHEGKDNDGIESGEMDKIVYEDASQLKTSSNNNNNDADTGATQSQYRFLLELTGEHTSIEYLLALCVANNYRGMLDLCAAHWNATDRPPENKTLYRNYYLQKHYDLFPYFAIVNPVPEERKHLSDSEYKFLCIGCKVKLIGMRIEGDEKGFVIVLLGKHSNSPAAALVKMSNGKLHPTPICLRFLLGFDSTLAIDKEAVIHSINFAHSFTKQQLISLGEEFRIEWKKHLSAKGVTNKDVQKLKAQHQLDDMNLDEVKDELSYYKTKEEEHAAEMKKSLDDKRTAVANERAKARRTVKKLKADQIQELQAKEKEFDDMKQEWQDKEVEYERQLKELRKELDRSPSPVHKKPHHTRERSPSPVHHHHRDSRSRSYSPRRSPSPNRHHSSRRSRSPFRGHSSRSHRRSSSRSRSRSSSPSYKRSHHSRRSRSRSASPRHSRARSRSRTPPSHYHHHHGSSDSRHH